MLCSRLAAAEQVYLDAFETQHIRLETLQDMGHADLVELGIQSFGHRKSILIALQNYLRSYLQIYLRSCDMAVKQSSILPEAR